MTLDVGSLMGSLVGESERNIRQALRIALRLTRPRVIATVGSAWLPTWISPARLAQLRRRCAAMLASVPAMGSRWRSGKTPGLVVPTRAADRTR